MPFYNPASLIEGKAYTLTEFVEGKEVSSGDYLLVLKEPLKENQYPLLRFSKTGQKSGPSILLAEAHAQFGDDTWRHVFWSEGKIETYLPAGARTWNNSWVVVGDV